MIMQQIGAQRPRFGGGTPPFNPAAPLTPPPLMGPSGIGAAPQKTQVTPPEAGQSGGLMGSIMKLFGQQGGAGGSPDMTSLLLSTMGMPGM